MAKRRKQKPPLIPRIQYSRRPGVLGVVVVRIPKDTPPAIAAEAKKKARELAAKVNKAHERDHWHEKGWK